MNVEIEPTAKDLAELEKYIKEAQNLARMRRCEAIEHRNKPRESFYNGQLSVLEGVWVRLDQLFGESLRGTTECEDSVIGMIQCRRKRGRAKYGQTMERQDLTLRQWLTNAQEEALDLAIYLEAAMRRLPEQK